jgi:hypothetical protein
MIHQALPPNQKSNTPVRKTLSQDIGERYPKTRLRSKSEFQTIADKNKRDHPLLLDKRNIPWLRQTKPSLAEWEKDMPRRTTMRSHAQQPPTLLLSHQFPAKTEICLRNAKEIKS